MHNRDGFHIGGNMKTLFYAGLFTLFISLSASGQNDAHIVTPANQKFGPFPNFPKCTQGAVLHGDPSGGHGVTVIAKATAGCRIPMHFHTPNEEVGIISGPAKVNMQGEAAKTLTAGGYAFLPAKHPHEFTCVTACRIFVGADGVFDIHYVDTAGKEISLEEALKQGKSAKSAKAPTKP
jgi:quercetin dioxygenase-like cupin family protein